MRFSLKQVAAVTAGDVVDGRDPELSVSGASTDSRTVQPGMLFVPVLAERDGHDFIPGALASGAAAHLTSGPVHGAAVRVADTTAALQALGAAARQRLTGPVVGITGSVGKTTTKDLTEAALADSLRTHASYKSFNNELGVPLTLVNAPDDVEVVVVEMGARGAGHIAQLCEIAQPTIGVVLAVGSAHTELFGDVAGVAEAKGELVEALPATGTAVLNADDELVRAMASRTAARVLLFGSDGEVRANDVSLDDELRPSFQLQTPWGSAPVALGSRGVHTVSNALAAASAALAAGAPLDAVAAGLAHASVSPWRMEVHRTDSGVVVINDAYNANPMSMNAALDSLAALPARRRFAVLGVMAELGAEGEAEHTAIGHRVRADGVQLISVDVPAYGGIAVADHVAALEALRGFEPLGEGDVVLVKGSRVAELERVADQLLASD